VEAGVDARLCVLPLSDGMHDPKIASALRTSCFVRPLLIIWDPSKPQKEYLGVFYLKNPENTPRYGTIVNLRKMQSRRCIHFVSKNVKANAVYFGLFSTQKEYTYRTYRAHRTPHTHNIALIL
jgi:hypothetical protein